MWGKGRASALSGHGAGFDDRSASVIRFQMAFPADDAIARQERVPHQGEVDGAQALTMGDSVTLPSRERALCGPWHLAAAARKGPRARLRGLRRAPEAVVPPVCGWQVDAPLSGEGVRAVAVKFGQDPVRGSIDEDLGRSGPGAPRDAFRTR